MPNFLVWSAAVCGLQLSVWFASLATRFISGFARLSGGANSLPCAVSIANVVAYQAPHLNLPLCEK